MSKIALTYDLRKALVRIKELEQKVHYHETFGAEVIEGQRKEIERLLKAYADLATEFNEYKLGVMQLEQIEYEWTKPKRE